MASPALSERSFSKWPQPGVELTPGYSILLAVPGDLPAFIKLALETCARQKSEHLIETIIVPDQQIPGLGARLEEWTQEYAACSPRLAPLRPIDQLLIRRTKDPFVSHWLQVVRGIEAARTTHVQFHDADLFILKHGFLEEHYNECLARGVVCLGVDKAWDSWFAEHGFDHVVSPWEAVVSLDWFCSFTPWQHGGVTTVLDGELHTFDLTFWPQSQTAPQLIGLHDQQDCFIHFNHVIVQYRLFQKSTTPFEDENFRLLLIRLLTDAYTPDDDACQTPPLAALVKGLTDGEQRVTYTHEQTRLQYPLFRRKLQRLIQSDVLEEKAAASLRAGISLFDKALSVASSSEHNTA